MVVMSLSLFLCVLSCGLSVRCCFVFGCMIFLCVNAGSLACFVCLLCLLVGVACCVFVLLLLACACGLMCVAVGLVVCLSKLCVRLLSWFGVFLLLLF